MLHILFFRFFIQFSRFGAPCACDIAFRSVLSYVSSRAIRFSQCCGLFIHRPGVGSSLPVVGSNGLEPSTSRLSGVRSNHLSYEPVFTANSMSRQIRLRICGVFRVAEYSCHPAKPVGGDEQNRTVDPLLARQVLSQLSYAPVLGLCRWASPPF